MFNLLYLFSPGSCGAFCLKHILKKRVKNTKYMSLYEVKLVLLASGYKCMCLKSSNIFLIRTPFLSLILNKNSEFHYVVVKEIKKNMIIYYDPLYVFHRKEKIEDFTKKWSGFALIYSKE